jgi:hypothetical protein
MGMHLIGVHLMGVYLITLFRGCTATGDIAGSCLQEGGLSGSAPSLLASPNGESGGGSRCRTYQKNLDHAITRYCDNRYDTIIYVRM